MTDRNCLQKYVSLLLRALLYWLSIGLAVAPVLEKYTGAMVSDKHWLLRSIGYQLKVE